MEPISTWTVPLPEVSGLSSRPVAGGVLLLALGDDRVAFASTLVVDGVPGGFDIVTADDVGARPGYEERATQLEAVAVDGAGTAWLLTEGTSMVGGVDLAERRIVSRLLIDTTPIPDLHASWSKKNASRGEGMLLLRDGHLLVAKEKKPAGLVELGPRGHEAHGISTATLLGEDEAWTPPSDDDGLSALAWWPWKGEGTGDLKDLSDLAPDHEGGVWVLSDQSRCLTRLVLPLDPGEPIAVASTAKLPKRIAKPEGLAFLGGGLIAVADDRKDTRHNLTILRLA
ncbi:MAG: hypothetical protein AB7V23_16985 [Candidatus Nanopelagicales bacterium]